MKQIVLHIGLPKTGSSAIQVFLAKNHTKLRERSVEYLRIGEFTLGMRGKISSGNGAFLARSMLPRRNPIHLGDREEQLGSVVTAADGSLCETGIISSELLADVDKEGLSWFKDKLGEKGINIKILYFIRRQVEFLESAYMQQVKRHGYTENAEIFVKDNMQNFSYLRFYSFLMEIAGVFGGANIICRTYESALAAGRTGLCGMFLTVLGIDRTGFELDVGDVNTSLSQQDILILRLLNKLNPRWNFSDYLVENAIAFGSTGSGIDHSMFEPSTVRTIENFYREENSTMAERYFNRPWLFPEARTSAAVSSASGLSVSFADVVRVLGGLLVRYDYRLADVEATVAALRKEKTEAAAGSTSDGSPRPR